MSCLFGYVRDVAAFNSQHICVVPVCVFGLVCVCFTVFMGTETLTELVRTFHVSKDDRR